MSTTGDPTGWLDAHCHLADIPPHDGLGALAAARAAGVKLLINCGTQPNDWALTATLGDQPDVLPCFGLHPYWAERPGSWLDELASRLAAQPSLVGEIGLDRSRHGADWQAQEAAFAAQLQLARRVERPAVVHAVRVWGRLVELLEQHAPRRFLLHAYSGPAELVHRLAALGAWFSFAGATLRPGRERAWAAVRAVPADRLLAESDAPAVPLPDRAASAPGDLPEIVAGLAALRGEEPEALRQAIWANARAWLGALAPW